ncbi:MAG: hypothetical protein GY850_03225, partial [bacterium]|nr:hypothetical protein [bacterium]
TDDEFLPDSSGGFLFGESASNFKGFGLSQVLLEKIYHKNFERFVGERLRALNPPAIVKECDRLADMVQLMGAAQPNVSGDPSVAKMVGDYFLSIKEV